jgi:hypothetical protein
MDHAAYPKSLRGKSDAALMFTIQDAKEAMAALPNGPNTGYYADEVAYAAMELAKRRRAK